MDVRNLTVSFDSRRGKLCAVDRLNFSIAPGESLGIVGESGSGKSVSSLALMGLLPDTATVQADKMHFQGKELTSLSESEMQKIRGSDIAMIFQDPMTSLNPCFTVEFQLVETLRVHRGGTKSENRKRALELLEQVGIPDPEARLTAYPHELSGGMSQRVMIAIAIACSPKLLIADEPTTALDVTIQAQILRLLDKLRREQGMSLLLITHDIGVVSRHSEKILVMYAGQAVEYGATNSVIEHPRHPYTEALLKSMPGAGHGFRQKLPTIPGIVPDLANRPHACQLHPRCAYVETRCADLEPSSEWDAQNTHMVKCWKPLGRKSAHVGGTNAHA